MFYIHLNKALVREFHDVDHQSLVYTLHVLPSKPNFVQIPDEGFCILGQPQTQEGFDAMFSLPEGPITVVEGNPTLTVCVTKTGLTERTLQVNVFTSELDQGAQARSRSLQSNVRGFYFLLF